MIGAGCGIGEHNLSQHSVKWCEKSGLDGTEYFCSQKLSCESCSERKRANGKIEHFHAMVSAALVAPGHERALPLEPEFVTPRMAPRSRIARLARRTAGLQPMGLNMRV